MHAVLSISAAWTPSHLNRHLISTLTVWLKVWMSDPTGWKWEPSSRVGIQYYNGYRVQVTYTVLVRYERMYE